MSAEPTPAEQTGTPSLVDWDFAKATGRRLVAAGPTVSRAQAADEVAAIRAAAAAAHGPVAETSRLQTPDGAPSAVVVDRPAWIAANVDSLASLMDPVFAAVLAKAAARKGTPPAAIGAIGGKVAGAEAGSLLAFMASKVLGQYDLAPAGTPQLMLVAPNLVQAQRDLDVDADDFRSWVCMHEETHRVQFTATPWLRDHMVRTTRDLATDLAPDPAKLAETAGQLIQRLPEVFGSGGGGIADLFTTPEQRAQVAQVTAIMSLLEGHADVVMDEVGPSVIPTVATIRARFTERRKGAGAVDRMLRRLLGLEAKMRQYRDGAVFVRAVIDQVGWDDFNAIWTSPETLPTPQEIEAPVTWVARVHG
ncbi:MAG: zinc-dependent metalloprotease [Nostocoides sp.]